MGPAPADGMQEAEAARDALLTELAAAAERRAALAAQIQCTWDTLEDRCGGQGQA